MYNEMCLKNFAEHSFEIDLRIQSDMNLRS